MQSYCGEDELGLREIGMGGSNREIRWRGEGLRTVGRSGVVFVHNNSCLAPGTHSLLPGLAAKWCYGSGGGDPKYRVTYPCTSKGAVGQGGKGVGVQGGGGSLRG